MLDEGSVGCYLCAKVAIVRSNLGKPTRDPGTFSIWRRGEVGK